MNITKFYYLRIVLIGVGVNVAWITSLAAEAGANRFGVDLNVARVRSLVAGRVACATNALRNQYKATDPRCEENDCDAFGRTDI